MRLNIYQAPLLLYNKLPWISGSNNTKIYGLIFRGSGDWAQVSWVLWSGSHQAELKWLLSVFSSGVSAGKGWPPGSHRLKIQFLAVVGLRSPFSCCLSAGRSSQAIETATIQCHAFQNTAAHWLKVGRRKARLGLLGQSPVGHVATKWATVHHLCLVK